MLPALSLSSRARVLVLLITCLGVLSASCKQKEPIQFGTWDDPASRHLEETGEVFYSDAVVAAYVPFGVGEIKAKSVRFTITKKGTQSTITAWNEPVQENFSSLLIRFWDPTGLIEEERLQPGDYTLSVYRDKDLLNSGDFSIVNAKKKE